MSHELVSRAWRIEGLDAAAVTVEETAERNQIVVSVQQRGSTVTRETVRLNRAQWGALCSLQYDLDWVKPAEAEA